MGMHADCGHGIIMATSMAQLHMQAMIQSGPTFCFRFTPV